jgi:GNAT acetyltransferase-like protein
MNISAKSQQIVVRRAERSDLAMWQDFVDRSPDAGCMHHAAWYEILREAFWVEPHFLIATDNDAKVHGILALYQSDSFLTGRHISSLEEGILAADPNTTHALLTAALELRDRIGAKYLQIRGSAVAESASKMIRTVHTILHTNHPEDVLWAAVRKKTRWAIKQNVKRPIAVEHDPSLRDLENFYRVYAEHMHALGTPVPGFEMFDSIRKRLGTGRLRLYIVRCRERIVGGMLCILNTNRWTDQYAIVRPSKETEFANYLLYWHAIRDAAACKVPLLDLGRCTPNGNVHLFKRKWGGVDIDVPYYFYSVKPHGTDNFRLEDLKVQKGIAQRIWSRLPLGFCNRIGPLLRKQLPFI